MTLAEHLPSLDQRLRKPEIAELVARVGELTGARLAAVLGDLAGEIQAWEADLSALEAALEAGPDRALLDGWLQKRSARLASDRRALRRNLDLSVIRERTLRAVARLGILEELALRVLARIDPSSGEILALHLAENRRWQGRLAAAEGLLGLAPTPGLLDALRAASSLPGEQPFVRAACDAALLALDRAGAAAWFAQGLVPRQDRGHFLLRRRRLRLIAEGLGDPVSLLALAAEDPSEHVRVGLAAELGGLGGAPALALLGQLAADSSPRVRLAVAVALRRNLARFAAADPSPLLMGLLLEPGVDLVRVQAAEALGELALLAPPRAEGLDAQLGTFLQQRGPPAVREAAAAARQRAAVAQDPAARAWLDRLGALIPEIRPGQKRRIRWSEGPGPLDETALGRLLSLLAREDFGLSARMEADGFTLWRGDRVGFRLWRLLHETFRPAPNKRQDHSHLIGRKPTGVLRAPPGRMAEVTATQVPGERVVADREGGWGRHLPTVDDLLDLVPGKPVRIWSSFGATTLTAPGWGDTLMNRLRLIRRYPELAATRLRGLQSAEPIERRAYLDAVGDLGVRVEIPPERGALGLLPLLPAAAARWLHAGITYILSPTGTSQQALTLFTAGAIGALLVNGWWARRGIRQARASIPLSIGGWGTRGKSGTERIKAAIFHGLGHMVVAKTTGCEAMFIPAYPGQAAREIFLYRPYDKSTIWEQAGMLRLASRLGARVFHWECMALRPRYVELLELDWMRDDYCTLTNGFPDHEDIQGPAGVDVATTITSYVPAKSVAFTSEVEFLPLFMERARERETALHPVDPLDAELLGADLLAMFPYQEHPRNIALVRRLAAELGIDVDLATLLMAENVVPDLGVLRTYPRVGVHGRALQFVNGMSANERTGCVANWVRTGLAALRLDEAPERFLVTVVNNRADRVARSEVFARILVEDLSIDRHVLIGTNLRGLLGYIEDALRTELGGVSVRLTGDAPHRPAERIATWMERLRIPAPETEKFFARAEIYARGVGQRLRRDPALVTHVEALLAPDASASCALSAVEAELGQDAALGALLRGALTPEPRRWDVPEVGRTPDTTAWERHTLALLARMVVHARLAISLSAAPDPAEANAHFRRVWSELFRASLIAVEDPDTSGDRLVEICAEAAPPGAEVTILGVQNIKGTGLDFAYRWVALGAVVPLLERAADPGRPVRIAALRELLAFEDHGLVDAGTAVARLSQGAEGEDEEERALRRKLLARVTAIHATRLAALGATVARGRLASALDRLEGLLDWLDSARRTWEAERLQGELVRHQISLAEAARQMQALTTRQKGGWLAKAVDL